MGSPLAVVAVRVLGIEVYNVSIVVARDKQWRG
jgi:hypothetical protein